MKVFVTTIGMVRELLRSFSIFQGTRDRTDSKAQPTSSTISSYLRFMSLRIKGNCLITRIQTGHITFSTVHAKIISDNWEFLFFWHVGNVFDMFGTSTSDVFQSWNLLDVYLSWFLVFLPQVEVILEFFQFLHRMDRWALTFPSFLDQIISLHQI